MGGVAPGALAAPDPRAVQEQMNRSAAEYARIESDIGKTDARIRQLEEDLARADDLIGQKRLAMRQRAGYLYKTGGVGTYLEGLLTAPDIRVFLKRLQLIAILDDKDAKLIDGFTMTKARADQIREDLSGARSRQSQLLRSLRSKQHQLEAQLKVSKSAVRVARFGTFDGFTIPVLGAVAFSDSWGDPRSGGRRHQGTDLMAPCGAKVVAVTDGTIQSLSSGGNGGIMLWLRARNGDVFFYAHLKGYAPGVHGARRVSLGEHIAYNGNSGNARGGPCHVHFEWHPRGGRAVNPYRLLRSALG